MLSEYDGELLTAYVDGEMTRRQRKAVLRLLHQSSEARAFLRDLQENAHLFKLLPHHKLEGGFADQVLNEIAARGLKPLAAAAAPAPRRWRRPLWFATAAAAAIVLAVGLWFGLGKDQPGALSELATLEPPRKLVVPFKDLTEVAAREEFRRELERESRVHLDLAVRNQPEAFKQLERVLGEHKLRLDKDPRVAGLMKKPDGKTQVLFYLDGVRPEEVVEMLQQLGTLGAAKGKASFESVTLTSLDQRSRSDKQKELPRPKGGAAPERLAMILANAPAAGARFEPSVEAFLAVRRDENPGAVQIVVSLTVTA
jgi:hypothetical protein